MDELPQSLSDLFSAELHQDWARLRELLHPEVVWTVIGHDESRVHGAEAYVSRLRAAYEHGSATGFTVRHVRRGEGGLVATELIDEEGNVSLDIFELDPQGRVLREWEHLLG